MIDLTFFFPLLRVVFPNIPEYKNFILYFLAFQHYIAQHKILSRLSLNIESEWVIMLMIANPCDKCQKLNSWVSDVGAPWCSSPLSKETRIILHIRKKIFYNFFCYAVQSKMQISISPWTQKLKWRSEQLSTLIIMLINRVHNMEAIFLQVTCTTWHQ